MKDNNYIFKYLKYTDLEKIKKKFNNNKSIKYVVIDNFIKKKYTLTISNEHKSIPDESWLAYNHYNQKKMGLSNINLMGKCTKDLINELSSTKFTKWLSDLSGIQNLISDPSLDGGGLHKISRGGFLNIHTDFQSHTKYKNWKRKINLLLYLSPEYKKSWRGELELRDYKDNKIIESISPKFNRCVIFITDSKSYHGHPKPLNSPKNLARRSLALYYFQVSKKNLPLKPTKYISVDKDDRLKKILIKVDVIGVYIFSFLKRYSIVNNDTIYKIKKAFKK